MEAEFFVWINIAKGLLRHQGAFVETGQNEFELAGIGIDITDGKNARCCGFKFFGIHRHKVFMQVQAEIGYRSKLHRQPIERQQRIALNLEIALVFRF